MASIAWVVSKLRLSDLPKKHAYEFIADNVTNGCFEMYFDEPVIGTDATDDVGMVCDGKGQLVGWSIENGFSFEHLGRKVAAGSDVDHSDGQFKFVVNDYYFNDERFYPSDSEGVWHRPIPIDVDLVSFDKSQVNSFVSSNNFNQPKNEQGILKALALLARDLAENNGAKFKTGNKVNALAFKKHILSLANKYEISDGYLKSLNDKVNQALKDLDLNDIPPNGK